MAYRRQTHESSTEKAKQDVLSSSGWNDGWLSIGQAASPALLQPTEISGSRHD